MHPLDYLVLLAYFGLMIRMGSLARRRIRGQEDYFLGGRSFGLIFQAFAAFGAGTGSSDPVATAGTTFKSGMSGIWSTLTWLFVTPFYWFAGVWYRRMRHLTLGDWFVERYESPRLGAAYTAFGLLFYMVFISMLFSAIGKAAAPLLGEALVLGDWRIPTEYLLVPLVAVIVVLYGAYGGLLAAYWTDVLQGLCIIALSILLIPFGLQALVERFGDPRIQEWWGGFSILGEQLPRSMFTLIGSAASSEFPLHRIVAVTVILLVGIVVMPHFIATGGGSARSESSARIGLVAGNLTKRFCTIGWALTAMIVLALYAGDDEVISDPDRAWGVASRDLLPAGLRGLMLACLLAALMSSVDCYMLVCSGLLVRNVYVPFVDPSASESRCLLLARLTGGVVVAGAVIFAWSMMDVFRQLQLAWLVPMIFAAPFWLGLFWRRATTTAAWITVGFVTLVFFVLPWLLPVLAPGLKTHPRFAVTTHEVIRTVEREATPADVRRRPGANAGEEPLRVGDAVQEEFRSGGKPIYWSGGVEPLEGATRIPVEIGESGGEGAIEAWNHQGPMEGSGRFQLVYLLYDLLGMDMRSRSDSMLATMELPPKILIPFLVMILASLATRPNSRPALDRYYAKMRTPVHPDPATDRRQLREALRHPERLEALKLFPRTSLEFGRPDRYDILGFALTWLACFGIIALALGIVALFR